MCRPSGDQSGMVPGLTMGAGSTAPVWRSSQLMDTPSEVSSSSPSGENDMKLALPPSTFPPTVSGALVTTS